MQAAESATSDEQDDAGEAGAVAESTFSAIKTVVSFSGQTRAIKRLDIEAIGLEFKLQFLGKKKLANLN